MDRPLPHAGRIALVTGAAQGLGRAIAHDLASDGATLICLDRADAGSVVDEIVASGGQAFALRCDIADPADVKAACDWTFRTAGMPHILVNNAGIFPVIPWRDLDFAAWRSVMSVNLDGTFLMCRAFGPGMEAYGWGRIVNIVTSAVGTGVTDFTHYLASKMGVIGLTRALASEYGPSRITVNAVAPSLVRTPATIGRARSPGGMTPDEEFAALIGSQAVKRSQQPDDVSGIVSFLASDKAGFITGQTIFADGGIVRT